MDKPIYNHVTGLLDPPERINPPKILVIEGLHPFFDERVNELLDFRIYLDISGACSSNCAHPCVRSAAGVGGHSGQGSTADSFGVFTILGTGATSSVLVGLA